MVFQFRICRIHVLYIFYLYVGIYVNGRSHVYQHVCFVYIYIYVTYMSVRMGLTPNSISPGSDASSDV